jgi:hypothetical protein
MRRSLGTPVLLIIFSFCIFALHASGDDSEISDAEHSADLDDIIEEMEADFGEQPQRQSTTMEQLEDIRNDISDDIESLASRIDSFFVNENVIYGRNTTNIRLFNTLSTIEGEGTSGNVDFKLRLQLPRLKNKLQFEVERQLDDYTVDRGTGGGGGSSGGSSLNRNAAPQRTRAGFSFFTDVARIQTKLTSGLEYNKGLDPYANLRLSRNFKISSSQNFTTIANFFAGVQDKTKQVTTFYYDIGLRSNILLRVLNEGTYRDLEHKFETIHGFIFFHEINDRNSMSYTLSVRGVNPPAETTFYASEYYLGTTIRHRLYKRFLYLEASPGMSYPKIKDFEQVLQFYLRLEVIFGKI